MYKIKVNEKMDLQKTISFLHQNGVESYWGFGVFKEFLKDSLPKWKMAIMEVYIDTKERRIDLITADNNGIIYHYYDYDNDAYDYFMKKKEVLNG